MTAFSDAARQLDDLVRRVEELESEVQALRAPTLAAVAPPRTAYKVSEVAEKLRVHPQTVRNMIGDGRLEAEDMGGWYAVPAAAVEAIVPRRSA